MNSVRFLVLAVALAPALATAGDRALPKAIDAITRQDRPAKPDATQLRLVGESTELSAAVTPPQTLGNPADAGVRLRHQLSDTVTARAASQLLVDAPEASPGTASLPTMRKQESIAFEWLPSERFGAEAFTRLTGQAGGESFFDRADLERGTTISLQPTATTRTTLTGRHRQALDTASAPRDGTRLDANLSQKLGSLPLTATIAPAAESAREGSTATTTLASRQALVWNASADTLLSLGTRWTEHDSTRFGESHQSLEAFSRLERTVSPDVALAAQTSIENRYRPDLTQDRDSRKLTLQAGPTFRLANDLSASLDFKSSFDHRDRRGLRDAEQALSFSLNGKF